MHGINNVKTLNSQWKIPSHPLARKVDGFQNQYGCGKRKFCPHQVSVKHDANHFTDSSVIERLRYKFECECTKLSKIIYLLTYDLFNHAVWKSKYTVTNCKICEEWLAKDLERSGNTLRSSTLSTFDWIELWKISCQDNQCHGWDLNQTTSKYIRSTASIINSLRRQ
jgi:hypothetical protein